MRLLKHLADAVSHISPHPIDKERPDIRGVKLIYESAMAAVLPLYAGDYIVGAEDGRVFKRPVNGEDKRWYMPLEHGEEPFHSRYLDDVVRRAEANGLQQEPSAFTIYQRNMAMRREILFNGTDEEVERLDEDYPSSHDPNLDYKF